MKIAIDAMGGDHAPREIIKGTVEAVASLSIEAILVGDRDAIERELAQYDWPKDRIHIHHASQVVEMDEHPALALRKKKDSSIVVGTMLVKEGKADAIVSCGNTGAQLAAAMFILDRFSGIDRPSLAVLIPGRTGQTVLVDAGANVDVKVSQMIQFALMGKAYAQVVLGTDNPRVALLSNGAEETKGTQTVQTAHSEMKTLANLNFIGNIEGRDLFSGLADVVVCDGFVGNTLIKTLEGFAFAIMDRLDNMPGSNGHELLSDFDYTRIGGAPLLGVGGISIVCHGSSKSDAIYYGIKLAEQCAAGEMAKRIESVLTEQA